MSKPSAPKTDAVYVPFPCACPGALPLPAVPPGRCCWCGFTPCPSDACTEMPVVVQIPLCLSHTSAWKCHVQLLSSSLGSVANCFFSLNPQQKPRNLYQLIQLLALVLKAEVQWCAGQIASARRYCAVVYFGSTDAIYSC